LAWKVHFLYEAFILLYIKDESVSSIFYGIAQT